MLRMEDVRALIIEPPSYSRTLTRSLLTAIGVSRVTLVETTEAALIELRNLPYDVAICDEVAPALGALGFLRALRRDLTTANVTVPVLMLSAGADFKIVARARDAGMNDVLARPVSPETIRKKLQTFLLAPKPFVATKTFIGPDRRSGEERRSVGREIWSEERRKAHALTFAVETRFSRQREEGDQER